MFNFLISQDISDSPLWKAQVKSRMALRDINLKIWLETNVLSPVWWLMVIMFIGLWFLWWRLVDKSRLLEIIAFGMMVTIFFGTIDVIATQNVIWGYPNRLAPLSPPLILEDFCVLPIVYMLVYQFFTNWRAYFLAIVVTGLTLAFVVEPVAVWLDIFQLNKWEYSYSLFIYLIMALSLKWIMVLIIAKQDKSNAIKIK